MVAYYAEQVRLGKLTLERVPARYRDSVREMLENGLKSVGDKI